MFVLAVLLTFALFPGAIAPYDATKSVAMPLQKPGKGNILGTNDLGQDLFSELIAGTRASLLTGLIVSFMQYSSVRWSDSPVNIWVAG